MGTNLFSFLQKCTFFIRKAHHRTLLNQSFSGKNKVKPPDFYGQGIFSENFLQMLITKKQRHQK
ncbi:hypothetical protein BW16_06400 [Bacillus pumilus]|nr:hypothetical protein BW16_06400 [Bacillus pumilus]